MNMPDDTSSSKTKFLTPQQFLMLITLLSGAILSQFQPLQSRRESEPLAAAVSKSDYEITASYLEDPLAVTSGVQQPAAPPEKTKSLPEQLDSRLKSLEPGGIQVICSLIRSEKDSMSRERRHRERLAVVSALAAAGYGPERRKLSMHYFNQVPAAGTANPPAAGSANAQGQPNPQAQTNAVQTQPNAVPAGAVPYEWFRRLGSLPPVEGALPPVPGSLPSVTVPRFHSVCVIWFSMDDLWGSEGMAIGKLRARLGELFKDIPQDLRAKTETVILGPPDSDSLAKMLREAVLGEKITAGNPWAGALRMASPYATASAEGIIRESRLPTGLKRQDKEDEDAFRKRNEIWMRLLMNKLLEDPKQEMKDAEQEGGGGLFLRTMLTDDYVAEATVAELERRGIDVKFHAGSGLDDGDILLISEFDTSYGRELPLSFLTAAGIKGGVEEWGKTESRWHWTPFVRGLDGRFGRAAGAGPEPVKESTDPKKRPVADEPRGTVQTDALRRLAERIEKLHEARQNEGKPGIVAVGVLGADIYDKLLIFRALRPLLKDSLFFTIGIDAWLWESEELRSTRNLIVASPFGLRLSDHWQAGMPPFRDSYQTSVYAAALALVTDAKVLKDELTLNGPERARLFEIGRSLPVDLSLPDGAGPLAVHPSSGERIVLWSSAGQKVCMGILFALMVAGYVVWLKKSRVFDAVPVAGTGRLSRVIWSFSAGPAWIIVVLPLAALLAYMCSRVSGSGEVFLLFSGVSSWPFFILSVTAAACSVFFILHALELLKDGCDALGKNFFQGEPVAAESAETKLKSGRWWLARLRMREGTELVSRPVVAEAAGPEAVAEAADKSVLDVSELWAAFRNSSHIRVRAVWTVCIAALFLAGMALLSGAYPAPLEPVRGEGTRILFWIVEKSSFVLVILLTALVLDSLWLNRIFIDWFARGTSDWPPAVLQRYAGDGNTGDGASDYVDLRLIADWTRDMARLTTLPFYIAALLLVSRFNFFDVWRWPVHASVVFGVLAALLITAAWRVHSAAERLRMKAVKKLSDHADAKLIAKINDLSHGAFMPFSRQPVMAAVYWVIGALSVTGLWQGLTQLLT